MEETIDDIEKCSECSIKMVMIINNLLVSLELRYYLRHSVFNEELTIKLRTKVASFSTSTASLECLESFGAIWFGWIL